MHLGVDPFRWTPTLRRMGVEKVPYVQGRTETNPTGAHARVQGRDGGAGARRRPNSRTVARDLGLADSLVHSWLRQAEVDDGRGPAGTLTTAEKEELSRLRPGA
jgi:hypothetical protein